MPLALLVQLVPLVPPVQQAPLVPRGLPVPQVLAWTLQSPLFPVHHTQTAHLFITMARCTEQHAAIQLEHLELRPILT